MTAFGAARFVRAASSNLSGLVKYFRNTDLVYAATHEVELAIWRRNLWCGLRPPPDGMGVGVEKGPSWSNTGVCASSASLSGKGYSVT